MIFHDQNTYTDTETKPDVPPPLTNQLENKKRNNNSIINKKEGVNSLQTVYTSPDINNNILGMLQNYAVDQVGGETFGSIPLSIRVPAAIYNIYRLRLTGEEQKIVRELLRQFFVYAVSNAKNISLSVNSQKQIVVNAVLNVLNVKQENVNVSRSDSALKLKREIDRLNHELEKLLSENLELKKQIEELKSGQRQDKDVQRKISELQSDLENYKYYLAVVYACLDINCDLSELREYIKNKIIDYFEKNKDRVLFVVKHLTRRTVMPVGLP